MRLTTSNLFIDPGRFYWDGVAIWDHPKSAGYSFFKALLSVTEDRRQHIYAILLGLADRFGHQLPFAWEEETKSWHWRSKIRKPAVVHHQRGEQS
jgi:hypothetical protein